MNRLKDKVVIVTGSTSGIGIGIAKLCAKEAAQVVITGRNAERGQKVVDEIAAEGGNAWFHAGAPWPGGRRGMVGSLYPSVAPHLPFAG